MALVTGSTRGIGRAVAERLMGGGYEVVIHGAAPGCTDSLLGQFRKAFPTRPEPTVVHGDVADPAAVASIMRQVQERHRRLDALVVNAGIYEDALLGMCPTGSVDRLFQVNSVGATHTLQAAVRLLRRGTAPSVVFTSSVSGIRGQAGAAVYSASKAAVIGLALAAAKELGRIGIRVNAVAPGMINTEMTAALPEDIRERHLASITLARFGGAGAQVAA